MTTATKLVLRFPPELTNQPITWRMVKEYDLMVNILRAAVNENEEGFLVVELGGESPALEHAVRYLREAGVRVEPLAQDICWDEELCSHCGLCQVVCPAQAFEYERPAMRVRFHRDRCIACEACVRACPVRAISVRLIEGRDAA